MPDFLCGVIPDNVRSLAARAEPGTPIEFVASTENVARDGLKIDASGWDLDNYRKNPVFLWIHDYGMFSGGRPPIGRADVDVKDKQLIARVTFDQGDPFARDIERKYREGFLNAVSVGWDTKEFKPAANPEMAGTVARAELIDISGVPIPGDPDALKRLNARSLAGITSELTKIIESDPAGDDPPTARTADPPNPEPATDPPARATWDETAAAMVRVFRPFAQRPDDERERDYQRLTREYARHKKTAPEFQTSAQLEALGDDELRGLFLEGEPQLFPDEFAAMASRAGAVLSARNRSDLERIRDLADAILNRSKKDDAEEAERAAEEAAARLRDVFGVTA